MSERKYSYVKDDGNDCSIINLREAVFRVLSQGYSDHAVDCVVKAACSDRAMHLLTLPREEPDPRRCFTVSKPTINRRSDV